MADVKIDQAKAVAWVKDVQGEINSVERTLQDVRRVCANAPGENDSIFQMIEKTGNFLEESWNRTTSAFKKAWEKLEEGIKIFGQAGEKVQTAFDDFKKKI